MINITIETPIQDTFLALVQMKSMCADHETSDERSAAKYVKEFTPAQVVCHSKEIVLYRHSFFNMRLHCLCIW